MNDPFGCAAIRQRTLATWALDPARLRADANIEQDFALGGYRDRVVVELAQNAADAATRAGEPGRLLLRLTDDTLIAANTGAALQPSGVAGLASMRASDKVHDRSGGTVGRFGVGFAAVLALTDAPAISSTAGCVGFSAEATAAAVAGLADTHPQLAAQLQRPGAHLPVLRLPFAEPPLPIPVGYVSAVHLPLRDGPSLALATRLLAEIDDALLLAMPALAEVTIDVHGDVRTLTGVADRWITRSVSGRHAPAALADRPAEERAHPSWTLTWAVARPGTHPPPTRTVFAPTPSDEPLDWPAMLIADLPLDPSRRHVADGSAARQVLQAAAGCYAELLADLASSGRDPLPLLPTGLPAGWVDAVLRDDLRQALADTRFLLPVVDGAPLRPGRAVRLAAPLGDDPRALTAIGEVLDGLIAAPGACSAVLHWLQVRELDLADLVESWPVPTIDAPAEWATSYDRLATLAQSPQGLQALASIPVPLADGRVVRGARGSLIVADPGRLDADTLAALAGFGLRIVAQHVGSAGLDLIERLGASRVGAGGLLEEPQLRQLVGGEEFDPGLVRVVFALLAAADPLGRETPRPWLADLLLPDAEGDPVPAGLLVLAGSPMDAALHPDELGRLHPSFADYPADLLAACGVAVEHPTITVIGDLDVGDIELGDIAAAARGEADEDGHLDDLDGLADWALASGGPDDRLVAPMPVVRDLDLVLADGWPTVLTALEADPDLARVFDDVTVTGPSGARRVPSYTTWWLRNTLQLNATRIPDEPCPGPAGFLPAAPDWVGRIGGRARRALGIGGSVMTVDGWRRVLTVTAALASRQSPANPPVGGPPASPALGLASLLEVWASLAGWLRDEPEAFLAVDDLAAVAADGTVLSAPASDVLVADDARWAQRVDLAPLLVVAEDDVLAVADALDLRLTSEVAAGVVTSSGDRRAVPAPGVPAGPSHWFRHDRLTVDGRPVAWWVDEQDECHASDLGGLARAMAWRAGRWDDRHLFAALLGEDDRSLLEHAYQSPRLNGSDPGPR